MARAGSCKIGLRPWPSLGIGNKLINGFEVKRINSKKPNIIICWNIIVRSL